MNTVYLDCSGLRNIRLENVPDSIYLDAENFLRQFESIVQQMTYEKPFRKVVFRLWEKGKKSNFMYGYFHRWGEQTYENREGQTFVPNTIAIIEGVTGVIYRVEPDMMHFSDWKLSDEKTSG